jgi:23S rRNA pseudouridine1911/1915/1917 synthase
MSTEQDLIQDENNEEVYEKLTFMVDKGQEPMRIDKWVQMRIEGMTRSKLQNGIEGGFLTVNGKVVKSNYRTRPGDEVTYMSYINPEYTELKPEQMDLDIVYEDDAVMVINKPANMVVHPGIGNYTGTLLNGVAYHLLSQNPNLNEEVLPRFGLVHRIDKNTTGLIVLAKTAEAASHLAKQFFNHTVERKYVALVWGDIEQDEGTVVAHIARHKTFRKMFDAYPEGEVGKHAITHYKVIERYNYTTLVSCILETGRTHQIRVHMKHIGHSIVCDDVYGDGKPVLLSSIKKRFKLSKSAEEERAILSRLALHSWKLKFTLNNETFSLEAEPPKDLRALLQQLRKWKG